jgi:two-component system, NtrC family, nitrogen regulation sensor histidine kinase NtrY
MNSKRYKLNILVRIALLVVFAAGAGWSFTAGKPLWVGIILLAGVLFSTSELISFVNKVNRQVSYFFESVKNEDFTLRLPASPGDPVLQELYIHMDEVNRLIQQTHIETRQMEQYFRSMIEHAATGIFSFDQNGFIVHANSAFRKMIGREVFTHIRQLEQVDAGFYKTVIEMQPADQRLVSIANEQGIIQLSLKAVSFTNQQSDLILMAVQDIRQALDEKELDSWLKLIRVLMHEIMNSIAPITSLADSLAGYFKTDGVSKTPGQIDEKLIDTTIRGLEIIREQGKGLTAFVESYRKLTRLPVPEIKDILVKNLVEKCLLLARSMESTSHIEMAVFCPDGKLSWPGDEQLLKQVLVNLLQNSVQALENRQNAKIEVRAGLNASSKLEICVKDNGPGIAAEILDQIFVPFFTTRPNGSGIGLSLSRQIMRLHKGSLTVYSLPDKETVFCMRF